MTNALHQSLAGKIHRHIRTQGLPSGHHLTESSLSGVLGVSRGPIRAAMTELAGLGVLRREPNRGFYVEDPTISLQPDEAGGDDEAVYLAIADDRLMKRIPEIVSENMLMRRYNLSREKLRRVLARIAAEGWIERREGRGWTFAQLIDSIEAYRESYELRQMLEPAGMLGDTFRIDHDLLGRLQDQQNMVRDGGWETLGQIELFETNSAFHEGLASMSGNRFLLSVIQRQNQLRRLVEYRQTLRREQVRNQNAEHQAILQFLQEGDRRDAAALLSAHLGNAKRRKANASIFS